MTSEANALGDLPIFTRELALARQRESSLVISDLATAIVVGAGGTAFSFCGNSGSSGLKVETNAPGVFSVFPGSKPATASRGLSRVSTSAGTSAGIMVSGLTGPAIAIRLAMGTGPAWAG